MPPKNRNNRNSHPRLTAHHHVPSDYDTDTAYATDAMTSLPQPAPIPARTNEELNLSVLQRHDPSVHQILSVAPFAVVYTFNPASESWEKQGTEGTLFVCSLLPLVGGPQIERYSCIVLNRRGLENFSSELFSSESVQVTDDYVILQVEGEDGSTNIYGLWIFAEEGGSTVQTRVVNALIIQECAKRAEDSRDAAAVADVEEEYVEEELPPSHQQAQQPPTMQQDQGGPDPHEYEYDQQPQGQQVSLLHLFKNQQHQRPALASPFQSHDQQQYYAMQQQHQQQQQQQMEQQRLDQQRQLQHEQQQRQQFEAMQQQQMNQMNAQQLQQAWQMAQHQQQFGNHVPTLPGFAPSQQHFQQQQQPPQAHPQTQPQAQADVLMNLFNNARRGY
ncbi:PH domain-like protein [Aureobasidium subglaciale]|nr:PH domain-like protein [Aureobasidium subglaciale]